MKYAYTTLLFGGDRYLPGVINLWYSLKKVNSIYDFVCMYTSDVSDTSIKILKSLNINTCLVEYVNIDTKKCVSKKQQNRYSKWASVSYTKWQCLNLDYDKVAFLDADMLVINNPDDIFKYKTPAAVFELQWPVNDFYKHKKEGIIKKEEINSALTSKGFVATATCTLLEPNKKYFKQFIHMLKSMQPFGLNCVSMFDEQAISFFYSVYDSGPMSDWSHIDNTYAYLLWKHEQHECEYEQKTIKIIDYFGKNKPWEMSPNTWPDLKYWWDSWKDLTKGYPFIKEHPFNSYLTIS